MSAKKMKLPDEEFLLKTEESVDLTKTVTVQIPDFTKKIDDVENKKKAIYSPTF